MADIPNNNSIPTPTPAPSPVISSTSSNRPIPPTRNNSPRNFPDDRNFVDDFKKKFGELSQSVVQVETVFKALAKNAQKTVGLERSLGVEQEAFLAFFKRMREQNPEIKFDFSSVQNTLDSLKKVDGGLEGFKETLDGIKRAGMEAEQASADAKTAFELMSDSLANQAGSFKVMGDLADALESKLAEKEKAIAAGDVGKVKSLEEDISSYRAIGIKTMSEAVKSGDNALITKLEVAKEQKAAALEESRIKDISGVTGPLAGMIGKIGSFGESITTAGKAWGGIAGTGVRAFGSAITGMAGSLVTVSAILGPVAIGLGAFYVVSKTYLTAINSSTRELNAFTTSTEGASKAMYAVKNRFFDWWDSLVNMSRGGPSRAETRAGLSQGIGLTKINEDWSTLNDKLRTMSESGVNNAIEAVTLFAREMGVGPAQAIDQFDESFNTLASGLEGSNLSKFAASDMFLKLQDKFRGMSIPLDSFSKAILDNKESLADFKISIDSIGSVNKALSEKSLTDLTKLTLFANTQGAGVRDVSKFVTDIAINRNYEDLGKILDPIITGFRNTYGGGVAGAAALEQAMNSFGLNLDTNTIARMYQAPGTSGGILKETGALLTSIDIAREQLTQLKEINEKTGKEKVSSPTNSQARQFSITPAVA